MRSSKLTLGMVLLIGLLFGCGDVEELEVIDKTGDYWLITGIAGDEGIVEEKSRFRMGEDISFQIEGDKVLGTPLKLMVVKKINDIEKFIGSDSVEIDPAWNMMFYQFNQFAETGDYTIKVFNIDNALLGEGDFSILP